MRQWLCCVVLRNVGLWLIFVAIIRTYPYPRMEGRKKETVTNRIQNNEVIKWYASHTHTHIRTYIYVSIYVGCATFFSRESRTPWRESRTNRLRSMKPEYDLPQNVESLILSRRTCLLSFEKSNNSVLSRGALKKDASSKSIESHRERNSLQSKVVNFCELLGIEIVKNVKRLRDSHSSVMQAWGLKLVIIIDWRGSSHACFDSYELWVENLREWREREKGIRKNFENGKR